MIRGFSHHNLWEGQPLQLINQTHRYIHYEDGSEELYDLRIDPDERNNLADRIDSGPIKQVMMNRIPKLNVPW